MSAELRAGYKQTEVGVIPEDWEVRQMGQIGTLTMGKGLLKEDILLSGRVPAIPYTALYTDFNEVIDYAEIKWFVDETSAPYVVNEPCVLIASSSNMEANTGKAAALPDSKRVAVGREVITFKSSSDSRYVSYLLSTASYRRKTLSVARGTTIKHLYPATFVNYVLALPPQPEQRAIAEALSDADALIESLNQLITKKRNLKQAAMQQLFTGQTRLPGFSGEWEVKRLGDVIAQFVGGGTPSRSNPIFWGDEIPWVTVKDFATFNPRQTQESITTVGLHNSASHLIANGTLITSTRMALGKAVIYEIDVAINQDLKALFPIAALGALYLYFWFQHNGQKIDDLGSGSTVKGIALPDLKKIEFCMPSVSEQTAIATILSDMDTELAELESRLAKARHIKQGMMQELLTGRIRLL